jgi:hypothetical protein
MTNSFREEFSSSVSPHDAGMRNAASHGPGGGGIDKTAKVQERAELIARVAYISNNVWRREKNTGQA